MSLNTKTSDRSYGHSHQQLRKAWAVWVATGPVTCGLCPRASHRERHMRTGVFRASEKNRHPAQCGKSLPDSESYARTRGVQARGLSLKAES